MFVWKFHKGGDKTKLGIFPGGTHVQVCMHKYNYHYSFQERGGTKGGPNGTWSMLIVGLSTDRSHYTERDECQCLLLSIILSIFISLRCYYISEGQVSHINGMGLPAYRL